MILGLAIFAALISSVITSVSAAPGDVVWTVTSNPSAGQDAAHAIAVDGTGIYVVGYDSIPGALNGEWRMQKRSKATGGVIWSMTRNPTSNNDEATGVAVDGTGVYVVGYDNEILLDTGGNTRWTMQKRNLGTGAFIWSVSTDPSTWVDKPLDVAVDGTGVYVVGFDSVLGVGNRRWMMQKRSLLTGAVIWTATSNPSAGEDVATGVAVDSTGVYVVGYDTVLGWPNVRWRFEKRNLATGALVWAITSNPSGSVDQAIDVAVDGTGIYAVGYDSVLGIANPEWRMQKRSKVTGAVIWNLASNPSGSADVAFGVTVDGTGIYVVGYDSILGAGNQEWRMQKRSLGTGGLIWSRTSNPTAGIDWALDAAVDATNVYIVGFYSSSTGWRIQKRAK